MESRSFSKIIDVEFDEANIQTILIFNLSFACLAAQSIGKTQENMGRRLASKIIVAF